jgi:hypothetical protein
MLRKGEHRCTRCHSGRGVVVQGEVSPVNLNDAADIERAFAAFERSKWRRDRAGRRVERSFIAN